MQSNELNNLMGVVALNAKEFQRYTGIKKNTCEKILKLL